MAGFSADENPLLSASPRAWDDLIEAMGPASLLVVIESRLSSTMRRAVNAEDVLQEALLHAWRDRQRFEWRGLRSFRSWLLSIIDNRIRDLGDRQSAAKRGGGQEAVVASTLAGTDGSGSMWGPAGSTTPSRIASFKEQAAAIHVALSRLPEECQDVVRLRLFEQTTIEEAAARLGIGEAAVRHRFRKGAELYHRFLREALASGVTSRLPVAPQPEIDSSPIS
jgi:RNA polymerase sigma factor (sigma-70 family)